MGYAAVPYMPDAAMLHVRRHFLSVMIMAECLIAILSIIWINTPRAP